MKSSFLVKLIKNGRCIKKKKTTLDEIKIEIKMYLFTRLKNR